MAKRDPDTIRADIARMETLLRKSKGKPGLAARVAEIEAALAATNEELAATNG